MIQGDACGVSSDEGRSRDGSLERAELEGYVERSEVMKEEESFPLHRGGRPGQVREKAVSRVAVAHNPALSGGRRWSGLGVLGVTR